MSINFPRFTSLNLEKQQYTQKRPLYLNQYNDRAARHIIEWKSSVDNNGGITLMSVLLNKLFKSLPKTELHLHLSGSTPIKIIREIMNEKGMSQADINEQTTFSTNFHGLDDFLKTYYKVAWVVKTPEHFKKAAYQICMDAAEENVKYLEIRTSAIGKQGTPDQILQAVTDGIKQAELDLKSQGFEQKAKIIVLAQRHHSPKESLEHAKLAVEWSKKPESLVVGLDVAGPEDGFPITFQEEAIRYAKSQGLNVTLHAGETNGSHYKPNAKTIPIFGEVPFSISGAESIKNAVKYGTDRLGHAVHLYDDPQVMRAVIDRQIPVESPPKCNVQLGNVDSYHVHPIKRMLDDNVLVSLSTDNRTITGTDLTNEYTLLYNNRVITSWLDIKKLVINGAKSVFLSPNEKQKLVKDFEAELKALENNPMYKMVIDKCLTPAQKTISFLGQKASTLFNNKAA